MFGKIKKFFSGNRAQAPGEDAAHAPSQAIAKDEERGIEIPRGQFTPGDEQEDPDFMGIHFEGMGNVWGAMFADESKGIADCIALTTSNGALHKNCQIVYQEEKTHVALLQAPEKGDIQSAVLLVKNDDMQKMQVWSAYPLFQGVPNTLEITRAHTWSNGVEGVVAAHLAEDGPPISFFAPFYFRDFTKFTPGAILSVSLGALAFTLKKAENMTFPVDKGPFYDLQLKGFLEENPGKTEADFSPPEVSLAGARILMPAAYVCEWSYRCPVLAVEYVEFMGSRFAKIATDHVGLDEQAIRGNLYAAEHVLQGYVPQAGDYIEGVLWMMGVLQEESLIGEEESSSSPTYESEEEIAAKKLSQAMLDYLKKRTVAEIATVYAETITLERKDTSNLSQLDFLNIANAHYTDGKIGASVAYKILSLRLFCSEFSSVTAALRELDHMFSNVDAMCKKEIGPDWLEKVIAERAVNHV